MARETLSNKLDVAEGQMLALREALDEERATSATLRQEITALRTRMEIAVATLGGSAPKQLKRGDAA